MHWRIPLAFLGMKAVVTLLYVFPFMASWAEQMGLRVLYLHVLLLGFVTLGLVYTASLVWDGGRTLGARLMTSAVLTLLASLIPLSGLWPSAWMGRELFQVAAIAAWLPVLAAFVLIVETRARPRRTGRPVIPNECEESEAILRHKEAAPG